MARFLPLLYIDGHLLITGAGPVFPSSFVPGKPFKGTGERLPSTSSRSPILRSSRNRPRKLTSCGLS
jgi:hypothetical protein